MIFRSTSVSRTIKLSMRKCITARDVGYIALAYTLRVLIE